MKIVCVIFCIIFVGCAKNYFDVDKVKLLRRELCKPQYSWVSLEDNISKGSKYDFLLVGSVSDVKIKKQLESVVENMGLSKKIYFLVNVGSPVLKLEEFLKSNIDFENLKLEFCSQNKENSDKQNILKYKITGFVLTDKQYKKLCKEMVELGVYRKIQLEIDVGAPIDRFKIFLRKNSVYDNINLLAKDSSKSNSYVLVGFVKKSFEMQVLTNMITTLQLQNKIDLKIKKR